MQDTGILPRIWNNPQWWSVIQRQVSETRVRLVPRSVDMHFMDAKEETRRHTKLNGLNRVLFMVCLKGDKGGKGSILCGTSRGKRRIR